MYFMEISIRNEFPLNLKEEWNELLARSTSHVPFLRFEYLSDWWQSRGGGEWPQNARLAILLGHQAGKLVGIAPCFVAKHEGQDRLLLLGSIEISDFLDLIVTEQHHLEFTQSLIEFVKTKPSELKDVNSIDFYNILENSLTITALQSLATSRDTVTIQTLQHCPFIPLPDDWETYLASIDKKQRHEIRRKMRRAAEAETPAQVYLTNEAANLEKDMETFLALMAQDPEKEKFLTPAMRTQLQQTMRCAFDAGCLQLAFLKIGTESAAAYLNFDYLNRIWVYNSGIDRRFMEYSPGWVLLGYLLQWAIENKREEFDFMRGAEDYKYRFGAVDRQVVRVTYQL
jgi:CelD/BcsL family acetyltransferase involved in cellulose biosynthesis